MRSLSLAASALLVLSACDSGGPDDAVTPRFEATVTEGVSARTLQGSATLSADLGGTGVSYELEDGLVLSAFVLDDDASDDRIALVGFTSEPLAAREYAVGSFLNDGSAGTGAPAGFVGAVLTAAEDGPEGPVLSTAGTVTITSVSAETISGRFSFDAERYSFEREGADGTPVTVEGTFTVDRTEQPVGPR